jgi:hypothetical protein
VRSVVTLAIASLFLIVAGPSTAQNLVIAPTTTLSAETGNNTSAANTFVSQTNGNLGAGNVSKVPTASLLYSGSHTRIYAHFMPWFGGANHMNVGYASNDATQVRRQVDDMMSRGIQGAIIDWYGPSFSVENQTTILMQQEAQLHGGAFEFAVMEDQGALNQCASTSGCDITGQLISDLTYAYNTFETSTPYMRINGRPVVFFFGVDRYTIDWARAKSSIPGNPLFVFQNAGGFTHAQSDGGFSWEIINTSNSLDMGLAYLDNFDSTALSLPQQQDFTSGYKGFNDSMAAWAPSPPRVVSQQCGATWLSTFAEAGKFYSTLNQLEALQLVTWNDYEEGTEIETGVDNCVTVAGSISGNVLSWSITGSQSGVDHFTVFISNDGQNLMSLGDQPATARALDLSALKIPTGSYALFVKAVGKPTMRNQMSGPVAASLAGQVPIVSLNVTPSSGTAPVTVTAAMANIANTGMSAASIDFGDGTIAQGMNATHTYNSAGTFTVTARLTTTLGTSSSALAAVTVAAPAVASGGCAASGQGVTVCSPTPGSSVGSPVTINAAAAAANPIIAMAVYVDNNLTYKENVSSVNTSLPMTAGSHYVVVQAWDSTGVVYKTPLTITATSTAPVSTTAIPETGWWWNPAESGRGFFIERQGNNLFISSFLYAPDGRATWVLSTGQIVGSTYSGPLTTYGNGQTLTGAYQPNQQTATVGTMTIQFADAEHGTLTWAGGTIPIQRFAFTASGLPATPGQAENGWWWNPAENGRGFAVEIQNGGIFIAGFMYDSFGNPIWYLSTGAMSSPTLYQGQWGQYAGGQSLTGGYQPSSLLNGNVGAISLQFTGSTSAILTLPDGRQIPLSRFQF